MMQGIPIGADMEYQGTFFDLLRPYPIMVGLMTLVMFAMHGSIYLYLKTEGETQERIRHWIWGTFGVFLIIYMLTTIFTLVAVPSAIRNFTDYPWAWVLVVLNVLAIANIPRAIYKEMPAYAFLSSACTIAALIFLFGFALFPNLVTSSLDTARNSLNVYNAASSPKTLGIMRIIAFLGMPFVIASVARSA